jgi:hypothetical protein
MIAIAMCPTEASWRWTTCFMRERREEPRMLATRNLRNSAGSVREPIIVCEIVAPYDDRAVLLMILSRPTGSNFLTKIKMLANANMGNTPAAIRTGK